jgi:ssDNA-binding Zn-finger/Zn-ribbon topoisomerase 1
VAKELVIRAWCDVCLADDDKNVPSVLTVTMAVDALTKELDLCPEHAPAAEEVRAFLELYGAVPDTPGLKRDSRYSTNRGANTGVTMPDGHRVSSDSPPARTCPECQVELVTRSAMLQHLKLKHDLTWSEVLMRAGVRSEPHQGAPYGARSVRLPDGRQVLSTDPEALRCPKCGRMHETRPKMRDHLWKKHKIRLSDLDLDGRQVQRQPQLATG